MVRGSGECEVKVRECQVNVWECKVKVRLSSGEA